MKGKEVNDVNISLYYNDFKQQKEIFIDNEYVNEFVLYVTDSKNNLFADFIKAIYFHYKSGNLNNNEKNIFLTRS